MPARRPREPLSTTSEYRVLASRCVCLARLEQAQLLLLHCRSAMEECWGGLARTRSLFPLDRDRNRPACLVRFYFRLQAGDLMRGAPGQWDFERLMFVPDFDSCAVFAVDLSHFDNPREQLAWSGKQSRVPDRTSEAHLRPFHYKIQCAACLSFVTAGRAKVAVLVDEEVMPSFGNQPERCSAIDRRCGSLARPVRTLCQIRGRLAVARLFHAICLARKPAH